MAKHDPAAAARLDGKITEEFWEAKSAEWMPRDEKLSYEIHEAHVLRTRPDSIASEQQILGLNWLALDSNVPQARLSSNRFCRWHQPFLEIAQEWSPFGGQTRNAQHLSC